MSEVEFADGLMVKAPHEKAPDFVKFGISIKKHDLIKWLQSREGEWVNLQVKESREGKLYAAVDNWKPKSGAEEAKEAIREPGADDDFVDSDLPF